MTIVWAEMSFELEINLNSHQATTIKFTEKVDLDNSLQ